VVYIINKLRTCKINGNTILLEANGRLLSLPKYTPTANDRNRLDITCRDLSHAQWKGGNVERTIRLKPEYNAGEYTAKRCAYTCTESSYMQLFYGKSLTIAV